MERLGAPGRGTLARLGRRGARSASPPAVLPELDNVWLAGGGSAEAFKFGPVLGEYIAHRVLDDDREPELAAGFRLKDAEFGV